MREERTVTFSEVNTSALVSGSVFSNESAVMSTPRPKGKLIPMSPIDTFASIARSIRGMTIASSFSRVRKSRTAATAMMKSPEITQSVIRMPRPFRAFRAMSTFPSFRILQPIHSSYPLECSAFGWGFQLEMPPRPRLQSRSRYRERSNARLAASAEDQHHAEVPRARLPSAERSGLPHLPGDGGLLAQRLPLLLHVPRQEIPREAVGRGQGRRSTRRRRSCRACAAFSSPTATRSSCR